MIRLKFLIFCAFLAEGLTGVVLAQNTDDDRKLTVAEFSANTMAGWESKVFDNETHYALAEVEGGIALKAVSGNSASGLFREISVDISKYPYLNWRWRIENRLSPMDETRKSGDDYAARIYLVIDGGFFFWKTKALNYVWSSRSKKDDQWPNAFAPDNTQMIAARTAKDPTGTWFEEKRNVYQALKQWLGEEVDSIDAVAIMTDTDNSDSRAGAYYGDIYFSAE